MVRDWLVEMRLVGIAGFLFTALTLPVQADEAAELDRMLIEALTEAQAALDLRVAEEKRTRDELRLRGDELDVVRAAELEQNKKLAKLAKEAERVAKETRRKAEKEEEQRQKWERERRREEERQRYAAREAAEREASQRALNAEILGKINDIKNDLVQTEISAGMISASARAQTNAINAERRAAAESIAAAQRDAAQAQARRDAARVVAAREAAAKAAAEAASAKAKAAASQSSSGSVIRAGVTPLPTVPSVDERTTNLAYGEGSAASPTAPKATLPSAEPAREPVRRHEAMAYCSHGLELLPAFEAVEWICDGPTQNTVVKETLYEALGYAGCRDARADIRRVAFRQGYLLFCEKPLLGWERDIGKVYPLPAMAVAQRKLYQCEARDCTVAKNFTIVDLGG